MRIISNDSARVTVLFPFEEVVPLGGANGREIVEKMKQRYEFLRTPDLSMTREEGAKSGYKFGAGQFELAGKKFNIVEFAIYSDGVVVDTNVTEVGEAFVDDITQWMRTEFGFRESSVEPRRYYLSQIVVEFDNPLQKLIPLYEKIASAISRNIGPIYKTTMAMNVTRLDFELEKSAVQTVVPRFIIERRSGIPFSKERYYSSAPMRTADHIAVLEEIEKSLG